MKLISSFLLCNKKTLVLTTTITFSNFLFAQGTCASPDGAFYSASGLPGTYAIANANGLCRNNLTAGQTYCWTYTYPASGDFSMKIIITGSCGNCNTTASMCLSPGCSGGFTSVPTGCGSIQYTSSCAIQESGGIELGTGASPAQTCGTLFTWCITVPAGCSTMDVCTVVSPTFCGILPVELLSFTGKNRCEKNTLAWTSASETNNDYYTLQRSLDGESFSVAAILDGAGNSTQPISYSVEDNDFPSAEQVYYRLSQTDRDGTTKTFNPISVTRSCGNDISISPSLTDDLVTLNFQNNDSKASIAVFDMYGQMVLTEEKPEERDTQEIRLGHLTKGIYLVFARSNNKEILQKVLVR